MYNLNFKNKALHRNPYIETHSGLIYLYGLSNNFTISSIDLAFVVSYVNKNSKSGLLLLCCSSLFNTSVF